MPASFMLDLHTNDLLGALSRFAGFGSAVSIYGYLRQCSLDQAL